MNYIFTFWEPKEKMPAYIKLCMQTWAKHFPDYKIVVCDYSNLSDYLTQDVIDAILYKKLTLPIQADAIRVALLNKHGGIWLDADTIITSNAFLPIDGTKNCNCYMISPCARRSPHMAFIYANKNIDFLQRWQQEIIARVEKYKHTEKSIFRVFKFLQIGKEWRKCKKWDYLGNAIVGDIIDTLPPHEFQIIPRNNIHAFAEDIFFDRTKTDVQDAYINTYFADQDYNKVLEKTRGILMLHNSWTPVLYKQMDGQTFLAQDIMLAKLLRALL